ncbi:MAG: histidinol-phosphatase [Wolinella sp.]
MSSEHKESMRYDLHNHTTRCNHAIGSMESYIDVAIACGLDGFGFACHAPMEFDKEYRMSLDELDDYRDDVLALRAKYANRCEILLGLEVDYLPGYIEDAVLSFPVDYLIGSVHFLGEWGFDNPAFIAEYAKRDMEQTWRAYLHAITEMAESELFDIVGHFDLLKVFGNHPCKNLHAEICHALEAVKRANMALEINAAGLRKQVCEAYPSSEILYFAHELEIPITFSSDAHAPEQVGFARAEIESLARDAGYDKYVIFREKKMVEIPL